MSVNFNRQHPLVATFHGNHCHIPFLTAGWIKGSSGGLKAASRKGYDFLPLLLGVPSPFFPGILLFRKPSKTSGKQLVFEKNDGGKEWGINP